MAGVCAQIETEAPGGAVRHLVVRFGTWQCGSAGRSERRGVPRRHGRRTYEAALPAAGGTPEGKRHAGGFSGTL